MIGRENIHETGSGASGLHLIKLIIFGAPLVVWFCLTAVEALAAGTPAGSIITNVATVTYTKSGVSYTNESNVNTLVVDDKVAFTLTAADVSSVTITSSGRACMTYTLTNTGNATHDYTLNAAVTGTPGFTPATGPKFYIDSAGTVLLPSDPNAGGLPYISSLAPDSSITIYMFITAPAQLTDGQNIFYLVTAESYQQANLGTINPPVKSSVQAATDATANKSMNPTARYVVLADGHGNGGDADRDGKYAVTARDGNSNSIGFRAQSLEVNIVKSSTVIDRSGGSQPASGATIRYSISVSATGSGTASGVVITDPLPANTSYTAGTLKLNGTLLTDAADSDAGDVGGTTPGTVTVRLGDMTSASPAQVMSFDVKID